MDDKKLEMLVVYAFEDLVGVAGADTVTVCYYEDSDFSVRLFHDEHLVFHEASLEPNGFLEDKTEAEIKEMIQVLYVKIQESILDKNRELEIESSLSTPSF